MPIGEGTSFDHVLNYTNGDREDIADREVLHEDGFDVYKELANRRGPFVDVAGPTQGENKLVDIIKIRRKLYTLNIEKGTKLFSTITGEFLGFRGIADIQSDARALPFGNESLGAVFCSCLGPIPNAKNIAIKSDRGLTDQLRRDSLQEFVRVLESGGLLVWQGLRKQNIEDILACTGIKVKQVLISPDPVSSIGPVYHIIAQKIEQQK